VLHPLGLRKAGEVDRVADQARLSLLLAEVNTRSALSNLEKSKADS